MANTKPLASQVKYGSGDNTVDKTLKKSILFFPTLVEAQAAAATLPDGQFIDVESEQKRYRVQSGALVFERYVEQLAQAITSEDGSALVGYDGETVQDALDDIKPVSDYAALLNYSGKASVVNVVGTLGTSAPSGIAGYFSIRPADPSVETDGGIKFVLNDGRVAERLGAASEISLAWFGIAPAMEVSDQSTEINRVISLFPGRELFLPDGEYRCDSPVRVKAGSRLRMGKGAVLRRYASKSSSQLPVLYLLDSYSECRGGKLFMENTATSGIAVLGHESASDNRNAWYWRFCDMDLEGNGSGWGWVIISGQVTYPSNANYFGTVQNVNTRFVDFGSLLFEDANAHNISNIHFWQCKEANIWLRGAYGNSFSNMFFHQGAKNGVVGIHLVNRVLGAFTSNSDHNKFLGFTAETGQSLDKAFVIEDKCTHNILIGTSNVAGAYTLGNVQNTIQLDAYGRAQVDLRSGSAFRKRGVSVGVATAITPSDLLGTAESGSMTFTVSITSAANGSLNRTDVVIAAIRSSAFGPSPISVISSAFTPLGVSGEPTSAVYSLDFSEGAARPRLAVSIGGAAGSTFNVSGSITKVVA